MAASAYLSCSRLYNDYDGIQHDYTKKQGLVWHQIFLPEYALQEWQNREKLWNAVEEVETAKDSRLAREFVVALPIELNREQQIELLQAFIQEQFVSDGMCADAAMKQSLKRLEEQGQKYSTELDAALNEYAGLREQAQGFNPVQLYETRQAIRPGKEQEAENRAQQVYGEKYNLLLMFDSKKAVSRMLDEDAERQNVRRLVRLAHKEQQTFQKEKSA